MATAAYPMAEKEINEIRGHASVRRRRIIRRFDVKIKRNEYAINSWWKRYGYRC
jgi:hypothetical protein